MSEHTYTTQPIVIFFQSPSPTAYPFNDLDYKTSYNRLAEFAKVRQIDLRFVLGAENYQDGTFLSYWRFENGELTAYKESFTAQMVYLKARTELFENEKRVNGLFLEKACRDKLFTAELFPSVTKKILPIRPDGLDVVNSLKTDMVVLKPRSGTAGKDVRVLMKSEISPDLISNDDFLIQELIDGSGGIPGLVQSRHELRMFVFNGKLHSAYLRIPAEGSYLSNIAQGASVKLIDVKDIPGSAIQVQQEIDKQFEEIHPRVYTVDVMFEHEKPWVVELNDQPGLPAVSVQPLTDNYLHGLLDVFLSA